MWSWVLAAIGSTGLFFVGEKKVEAGSFFQSTNVYGWCMPYTHTSTASSLTALCISLCITKQ